MEGLIWRHKKNFRVMLEVLTHTDRHHTALRLSDGPLHQDRITLAPHTSRDTVIPHSISAVAYVWKRIRIKMGTWFATDWKRGSACHLEDLRNTHPPTRRTYRSLRYAPMIPLSRSRSSRASSTPKGRQVRLIKPDKSLFWMRPLFSGAVDNEKLCNKFLMYKCIDCTTVFAKYDTIALLCITW